MPARGRSANIANKLPLFDPKGEVVLTPRILMLRWEKYRGLVFSISAAFAADWRCEVEEPYSLAILLFADAAHRWDGRVPWKKFLAMHIRQGLCKEQRRRVRRLRLLKQVVLTDYEGRPEPRVFDADLFVADLSPDAREAVRLALNKGAKKVYKGAGRRPKPMTKTELEKRLIRRGWTRARARTAFEEIRRNLP